MALKIIHKDVEFGIGDKVKVFQKIKEAEGTVRSQVFDGIVIAIKNRGENTTFTVRKIGEAGIGIERIFPLSSPFLEEVRVVKKGTSGVRRAKLYYARSQSPREIEQIYSRAAKREGNKQIEAKKIKAKASSKIKTSSSQ